MRKPPLSALAFMLLTTAAVAQELPADFRSISEFHHTAWPGGQGAPGDTYMIAQTPDGWLWMGGPHGLFRFDGVQFESVTLKGRDPAESTAISFLRAEDSGDLWVGWLHGGVSRVRSGSAQEYGPAEGLPEAAAITSLARDSQSVLWTATTRGLLRFDGTRWHAVGPESGFMDASALSLLCDDSGTFWIGGAESLYRIRKGQQRIERMDLKLGGNVDFLQSPDGRAWYSDSTGTYLLPAQTASPARPFNANAQVPRNALFDREGQLWTAKDAVTRFPVPKNATEIVYKDAANSRYTSKDGLTSNRVHSLLEDMEGNVWAVTAGGVDRFRPTNVVKVAPQGVEPATTAPAALAAGDDGVVWIGVNHGSFGGARPVDGLWKFNGQLTHVAPDIIGAVTAAERDARGAVWVGGSQGVWRLEPGGHFVKLPDLPIETRGRQVRGIEVDATGDPWVELNRGPLYRLRNGNWDINGGLTALPMKQPDVHARDSTGGIWFGYGDGKVAVVRAGLVSWYGAEQGLQLGMIRAIHVDRFTIVAGEHAVAILRDGRFHTLKATEEPSVLEGVTGVVEALDRDLWINGAQGAARVAASGLDEALRSKSYTVSPELFDAQDGYPGMALGVWPLPSLIRSTDGRLWFSGTLGVGWLDPRQVRRNSIAPPLEILSVVSDGMTYRNPTKLQVPKGARNLQINYTALSLSRPERVRFRYRLDGYDQAWIDAGTRRNAFYTNLPPGNYRFRVTAANESGVWNRVGASLDITLLPTFVQTRLFLALCLLLGLILMWGAYVVRVRQVTARERGRLEERLGERERIARELHDTLLQNFQSVLLPLRTAQTLIARRPAQAEEALESAITQARAAITEGRSAVQGLRASAFEDHDLNEAIGTLGKELASDPAYSSSTALTLNIEGAPRALQPAVRDEILSIAGEALRNAYRYAEASRIEVQVNYAERRFELRVRDDGKGIDPKFLGDEARPGHFGLRGMRERAREIGAKFTIWSAPASGTELEVSVPGSLAYRTSPRARFSWLSDSRRLRS